MTAVAVFRRNKATSPKSVAFRRNKATGPGSVAFRRSKAIRAEARNSAQLPGKKGEAPSMRRCRHHALEDELLDAFAVLHLGDVEVALGVDVHVMHHIELAGRDAVAAERVERLQRLAVEYPKPRRAAARDVKELLLGIVRECGAGDGLAVAAMGRLAIAVDEALHHELAVEREHLHALATAI